MYYGAVCNEDERKVVSSDVSSVFAQLQMYIIVNSPPPPSPMTPSKVIFNKWHIFVEDS